MKDPPRITLLAILLCVGLAGFAQQDSGIYRKVIATRARVIIDNDFGGDPDGLFALAHHLLSPTVEVKAIIGSKHYDNGFYGYPGTATHACDMARQLLATMKLEKQYPVYEGSNIAMADTAKPVPSAGATAIIKEALSADSNKPLYVVCGAGLTNIASALLQEPAIADRIILVWIGGTEYEGLAVPPPGANLAWEYNTGIDIKACQVVFNQSKVRIWQVPRNAYRQALVSYAELLQKVKPMSATGKFLVERLEDIFIKANRGLGEAYALGDSPLVLLTALQSSWELDPSSSKYVIENAPAVNDKGIFEPNPNGRKIRVYDQLDTRLMFADFFAKLALMANK